MSIASVLKDMEKSIGKEIFLSDWTQVTQEQINQFADSTKDHQWIHVDVEKAAKGPFGQTIAHGFLTLSHLPFFQLSGSAENGRCRDEYQLWSG